MLNISTKLLVLQSILAVQMPKPRREHLEQEMLLVWEHLRSRQYLLHKDIRKLHIKITEIRMRNKTTKDEQKCELVVY